MKKLFNNSTKGNDTQNQASKSKRKFLKTFSFTSLALLMGIAGTMAFAPLGASPNNLASASEMVDQVNTKADGENIKYAPSALGLDPENDPVIYTTESGLEIKYGGATTVLGGGKDNQNISSLPNTSILSGYPYFTMGTYNGYAVNWVIIGKSTSGIPSGNTSSSNNVYCTLSSLKSTNLNETPTYKYFFQNIYENITPAGAAVTSTISNDLCAHNHTFAFNTSMLSSIVANEEIPSGHILCVSECVLGTSAKGMNGYGSTLMNVIDKMYTSTLGLTESQKANIYCAPELKQSVYKQTSQTVTNKYMFPLGIIYGSYFTDNFRIDAYLSGEACNAYAIGTTTVTEWWAKTGDYGTSSYSVRVVNGKGTYTSSVNSAYGVRPACVIKIT